MAAVLVPAVGARWHVRAPDRTPNSYSEYRATRVVRCQYEYRIYGAGIPHRPYVSDTRNSCSQGPPPRRLRQNPSKLKSLTLYPKWTKPWHSLRTKPWHSLRRNQQEQCVVGLNDGAVVAREDALIFDRPDVANGRSAHDTYLR